MDIFKGQKLILKFDAVDISNGEKTDNPKSSIKYKAGTEVTVNKIVGKNIWLEFPDGQVIVNDGYEVLQAYRKPDNEKIYTRTIKGSGTPPKGLFSLMPEEAKWEMNYGWTVTVSLEELKRKEWICKDCYTELSKPKEEGDLLNCPNCNLPVKPISIDSIIPAL